MPLDPVIQALFAQMPQFANFEFWRLTPEQARAAFKKLAQFVAPECARIGKIENVEASTQSGPMHLRMYTPVAAGGEALAAIVFYHGGGFVVGDLESYDSVCRALANESGCRVLSVDYRLAPEHKFPAAV